ncbi:hypothetical protein CsatB_017137 [Cannabis sativa]
MTSIPETTKGFNINFYVAAGYRCTITSKGRKEVRLLNIDYQQQSGKLKVNIQTDAYFKLLSYS